ncbi:DUF317 domain-containing protein [Streptomyces sp. NPDC092952]|uniref:DUF317 domain-containing protein n=1 Tax=Streptomyces sp. NPDC092952 TaxID=3366018 RepID=UPI003810DEAC
MSERLYPADAVAGPTSPALLRDFPLDKHIGGPGQHSVTRRHTSRNTLPRLWWRLLAEPDGNEPGWYAEFGEMVPAEALVGLTDALVATPVDPARAEQVLEAAG